MGKKRDLPAMPFYVGDWLKCPEVRSLSPDYRGLWFDLICYMWESTERGVMVKPNGKPYSDIEIIRMVGLDNQSSGNWLTILIENGVCQRREDNAIFSRRMVKDEELRKIRKISGSKGGNPQLLDKDKDNPEVNQTTEDESEDESEDEKKNDKRFSKPSVEEIKDYCSERKNQIDPEGFFDYYESKGWKIGHNPMRDWKAAIRNWERNKGRVSSDGSNNGCQTGQLTKNGKRTPKKF